MKAKTNANGAGAIADRVTATDLIEKVRAASSIARHQRENGRNDRPAMNDDLRPVASDIAKIDIIAAIDRRSRRSLCLRSR